ncbi:retrovirus-related pol polyprotein from transposon TNT 1-94 [Tanacetum coccineum]
MALISLSFKKIYKPTNNNLKTSSNTSRANQDNTLRINRGTGKGMSSKRAMDAAYHKEKMLLSHYLYMAKIQEVTPDAADNSGPIFDTESLQKVQNDNDNYNVFANDKEHLEQPESINDTYLKEQGDTNITIDLLDMSTNGETVDQDDDDLAKERDLLASLIDKLKCEIDDNKNHNKLLESSNKTLVDKLKGEIEDFKTKNKSLESSNNHFKEANNKLSKINQLMFKTLRSPKLNLIGCYNDNLALMEYYYADHINAILGVYTTLDEFTDFQCDYVDQVVKCERLEKELSKSNIMSKSFEALQHAIDLELALQQCLKAQLQDKGIEISELKKLIEKMKGKYVEAKFEKPFVIRQPNAFKSQRQSVLGISATFSDSLAKTDLEVAFQESTCYIRDLNGNYLLTGKAKCMSFKTKNTSSSKRRLQILHMDFCGPMRVESFNDETPEFLIDFLKLVQRGLHDQVRTVQTGKGTKFLNKTLHAYFAQEGIEHQMSSARTPKQNGVVERQNCTLVEAARTMLSAAKVPLFFWAKAIATTCFTQNRSLVIPRHEKTPYHIFNGRKLFVKFFYIFGSFCYIVRDGENLGKMKEKETPPLNIQTTPETTSQALTVTANENINQAETDKENAQVKEDEFIKFFYTPVQERGETSTRCQLEIDGEMCMFALTVSQTEPKNIKEAMADSAWIKAMQEELY